VLIGGGQVGAWVPEDLDAAMVRAAGDPSFRVFLVLLPSEPSSFDAFALHPFLSLRTWLDLRGVVDDDRSGAELDGRLRRTPRPAEPPSGAADHALR
jgi:hypothetical protein